MGLDDLRRIDCGGDRIGLFVRKDHAARYRGRSDAVVPHAGVGEMGYFLRCVY